MSLIANMIAIASAVSALTMAINSGANRIEAKIEASPSCHITTEQKGRLAILSGELAARDPVQGTYKFTVRNHKGGNRVNIHQSGAFEIIKHETAQLGKVVVGGSADDYDVDLTIRYGGKTIQCDSDWVISL